jgi:hypothetical protein
MYKNRGARLRLNFNEEDSCAESTTSGRTLPGQNPGYLERVARDQGAAAWNSQAGYWDELPPSPRKVQASARKCPASPRRVPYSARKPKARTLHLTAHDSILGTPLGDAHGPVYPMHCAVLFQPCTEEQQYVLVVIVYRDDSDTDLYSLPGTQVACSSVAKNMHPGTPSLLFLLQPVTLLSLVVAISFCYCSKLTLLCIVTTSHYSMFYCCNLLPCYHLRGATSLAHCCNPFLIVATLSPLKSLFVAFS